MSVPSAPSLNWREIALILEELDLPGMFVREASQPDAHTIVLEVAGRGRSLRLLLRLAPPFVRMHTTTRRLPSVPKRFAALLRARIRGGKITEASQVGQERIVRLAIHRTDADTVLWIRLWSNAANAILTDPGGRILDTFHRRPKRGEITGQTFVPPAPGRAAREYAIREIPGEGTFNERLDGLALESEHHVATGAAAEAGLRALRSRETHLTAKVRGAEAQIQANAGYQRMKEQGDTILANLSAAAKGDRWLELDDERIELDPSQSPSENAQAYYARFKRSRAAVARLEAELADSRRELERVRAALATFEPAEGAPAPDPSALERALRDLGITAERPTAGGAPGRAAEETPGLRFRSGPFTILVGRSAAENDELLRRHVRGNDTWFHCRDYPGAYVFVRAPPGKSVPLEVMLDAATLAIHYSKAKASGVADVYYTAVKYLRRPRDGPKGLVLPTMERNLRVRLEPERVERLKGSV